MVATTTKESTAQAAVTSPQICTSCGSNLWCNQRVTKLVMSLRCHVCKANKKLNKNQVWYEWKCDTFHKEATCPNGDACTKMHIYYSKMTARNAKIQRKPSTSSESNSISASSNSYSRVGSVSSGSCCEGDDGSDSSVHDCPPSSKEESMTLDPYAVEGFCALPVSSAHCVGVHSDPMEDMALYLNAIA